ncbi:MAG: dockerin type I domain-containing protein [Oscillospiraceae bacterium]|jgi:predicted outer membrane repeat protein|nr:dockerin type I domain-containing protein [Oscillospiraceae bacterium]
MALAAALLVSAAPMVVWAAPEDIVVTTGAELDAALRDAPAGAVIVLANDIDAITSATYSSKDLTIDGQGYSINGSADLPKTALRFTSPRVDGVRVPNNVTIRNTVFQNLTSDVRYGGGAVGVYIGVLTIENSTFIGNSATAANGDGGAVLLDSSSSGGRLTIRNSTFVGNSAAHDGGAVSTAAAGEIVNVTFVGNTAGGQGGGYASASANAAQQGTVVNAIFSGNTAVGEEQEIFQAAPDSGHNVFTGADDAAWLSAELALNGGLTPSFALLDVADSPAIDKGDLDRAPALDQRGAARDYLPDIGAYEHQQPAGTFRNVAKLNVVSAPQTMPGPIDFSLSALIYAADRVNTVEAVFAYDPAIFKATAAVVPTGYEVASVAVSEEKGLISVVLGVANTGIIGFDDFENIVTARLIVRDGRTPSAASLSLRSLRAYSRGAAVELRTLRDTVSAPLSYAAGNPLDVNRDGLVDAADLSLALYHYGAVYTDPDWGTASAADVNSDGVVNVTDIVTLVNEIQRAAFAD